MSANINVIFQGILTLADETLSNAPYTNNLDLQNPTLAAPQVLSEGFLQVATSPGTTISFSFNAYLILVWNRSTTNTLIINVNATGGPGVQEVGTIGPGGIFVVMDPARTGGGWNGLMLEANGATVPVAVVLAG